MLAPSCPEVRTRMNCSSIWPTGITADWDVDAAVEDLQLFFNIGLRLANSNEWPQWFKGNEFRVIREVSFSDDK